jgi:GTP cyclohydrolase II
MGSQRDPSNMKDVALVAQHALPSGSGIFNLYYFKFGEEGQRVFALCAPNERPRETAIVRLRIQYACLYGTSFNATDCDCGFQLRCAMSLAAWDPKVLLLYFYDHEAEGLGLDAKVKYTQEEKETGQSFAQLLEQKRIKTLPDVLWTVPMILSELGFGNRVALMTKSLSKVEQLREHGTKVDTVETEWDALCIQNN